MSSENAETGGMYIALAAPSGVGKTSVVAALLAEANEVLAGTRVSVGATGETRKRLNKLDNALRGHLRAKQFVPGGIEGTQEPGQFSLEIRATGTHQAFRLEILDYPGGLLESRQGESWKQVAAWFGRADVLILPVDATLLMEAALPRHHQRAMEMLNLAEMKAVAVDEWAKTRRAAGLPPGMLVLAPVKGETYFSDNGGTSDRSEDLLREVKSTYGEVLEAVQKESPGVTVMYCPIDTIGCVEVMRVDWGAKADADPIAYYRVRGNGQLRRKGAADLFVALVGRMLDDAGRDQERTATRTRHEAARQAESAEEDRGLLENFWWWITRQRKRLRDMAQKTVSVAEEEEKALAELQATLEQLRSRPTSARVRAPVV